MAGVIESKGLYFIYLNFSFNSNSDMQLKTTNLGSHQTLFMDSIKREFGIFVSYYYASVESSQRKR